MNAIVQIIGIWFLAICFLFVGSLFVGVSIKESKLVRLFPLWVVAYCLSLASITPLIWYRWWEGPEDLIMIIWMLVTLSFAGLIIASLVVAIIKKRYGVAIGVVAMGILLFIYSVVTLIFMGLGEGAGDNFGKSHPIPAGMEYYTTGITAEYGNANAQAYLDSLVIERGIVMVDYGQPGQYRYMAYVPAIPEKGHIYLKLYEATTDFPLSEYIKTHTTLPVEASDTARIYMMKDEDPDTWSVSDRFLIQEGEWGDYYAARVELWYKPESSDEEKLLHSVIYRVEGWSR